jgi:hypothetical protein
MAGGPSQGSIGGCILSAGECVTARHDIETLVGLDTVGEGAVKHLAHQHRGEVRADAA